MKEHGASVITGRTNGGLTWVLSAEGLRGRGTMSEGAMRVKQRGSFSFQKHDKRGNESVIISRICLSLGLAPPPSPGPSTLLRSLVANGPIKEFHCPTGRQREWTIRSVLST